MARRQIVAGFENKLTQWVSFIEVLPFLGVSDGFTTYVSLVFVKQGVQRKMINCLKYHKSLESIIIALIGSWLRETDIITC